MYVHINIGLLGKRKKMTKLATRVAMSLQVNEAVDPCPRPRRRPREVNINHAVEQQHQENRTGGSSANEGKFNLLILSQNLDFGL